MKVAGIPMSDPWATRSQRTPGVVSELVTQVPVEAVVQVERVYFSHQGPEKNYRPIVRLSGELRELVPQGVTLPYGVDAVTFRPGLGPIVDARYEFNDAQLVELVGKGYFTEGFEPPVKMTGIPWELPTTIDALVLAPVNDEDVPVVFTKVHSQSDLALNAYNSGYDLAEYFDNQLTDEKIEKAAVERAATVMPTRAGELDDLFGSEVFGADNAQAAEKAPLVTADGYPVIEDSVFAGLLTDVRERQAAEAADRAAQTPSYPLGSAKDVYQKRIAPPVSAASVALPVSVPVPASHDGLLDLDTEGDLEFEPLVTTPTPERRRLVTASTAPRVLRNPRHQLAVDIDETGTAESESELE